MSHTMGTSGHAMFDMHQGMGCSFFETSFFVFASFSSTVLLTVTGFGNAIIFQLLYALANALGAIPCATIKESVFLQTIGATATIPTILFSSRHTLYRDLEPFLLLLLLPSMAFGSLAGVWSQGLISVPWLEVICGGFLLLFAINSLRAYTYLVGHAKQRILSGWSSVASDCENADVEYTELISCEGGAGDNLEGGPAQPMPGTVVLHQGTDRHEVTGKQPARSMSGRTLLDISTTPCPIAYGSASDTPPPPDANSNLLFSTPAAAEHQVSLASGHTPMDMDTDPASQHGSSDSCATFKSRFERMSQQATPQLVAGGLAAGMLGGILGGLTGIRGPPVLMFLAASGQTKEVIRCISLFMGMSSLSCRIWYYSTSQGPGHGADGQYFNVDDWALYLAVVLSGIAGVPVGSLLYGKINLEVFKALLSCVLVLAGIAMLIPGITGVLSPHH